MSALVIALVAHGVLGGIDVLLNHELLARPKARRLETQNQKL